MARVLLDFVTHRAYAAGMGDMADTPLMKNRLSRSAAAIAAAVVAAVTAVAIAVTGH